MKVHHLNCASMRPIGSRLVSGTGPLFATAGMVCHCLLVEAPDGLALVDTGLGIGAGFSAHDPVDLRTMQQLSRAEPRVR